MWRLVRTCQSQLRTSFGGIIGFDFPAVLAMAGPHGVDKEIASLLLPYADQGLMAACQKRNDDGGQKPRDKAQH